MKRVKKASVVRPTTRVFEGGFAAFWTDMAGDEKRRWQCSGNVIK
jgi:hypothetical protein